MKNEGKLNEYRGNTRRDREVELREYGGAAAMNSGAGGAAGADTKKDKRGS